MQFHMHSMFIPTLFRKSASCTHVSALLHALASMTSPRFEIQPSEPHLNSSDDETPITSLPCQWKAPKQCKESTLPISEATFEKHQYGKAKKRKITLLNDFDPRPKEFRGCVKDRLPPLLDKLHGKGLCISLLFDKTLQHSSSSTDKPALPNTTTLRNTVDAFKASLHLSDDNIRNIEQQTREQRNSPLWYNVRRYRITSSVFGTILHRKPDTPPDSLVLRILQPKQFTSAATDWGITHESIAREEYIKHQHCHGHIGLTVTSCGFHVSKSHPFLGASPDGAVYDPSNTEQPFGFLEIKCPYSARNVTPTEACTHHNFFCTLQTTEGISQLMLRPSHPYYCQVQGQMAVGGRPWCDFIVYTTKAISVQRINFDSNFWENTLLPTLNDFYDNCLGPEIVSPVHVLGLPIRNLKKEISS